METVLFYDSGVQIIDKRMLLLREEYLFFSLVFFKDPVPNIWRIMVKKYNLELTIAEHVAICSVLRFQENPIDFIATAINSEIHRREGRPRRGLKATQIMAMPQYENLFESWEIKIIASL